MKLIQEGLFAAEEQMPCNPRDLEIRHYALPAVIGKTEAEDAAARILSFSQQLDQWVGVSWPNLVDMMQSDYETHKRLQEVARYNAEEWSRVQREKRRYDRICLFTLGAYSLFATKPVAQLREAKEQLPFSVIFMFGPDKLLAGFNILLERGLAKIVTEGEGENAIDVFFPTPALASLIMQKQGVVVG